MAESAPRRAARVAAGLLLAWPLAAGAMSLSFAQALQLALQRNPDGLAARAGVAAAQAGVDQASGAHWPRLQLGTDVTRSNDPLAAFGARLEQSRVTSDAFIPANLNHPAPVTDVGAHLQLQLPLFTAGKLSGQVREAEATLRAAQAGDRLARQQLTAQLLDDYDSALTAAALERVAEQALQAAQLQLKTATSLFEQGIVVKSDRLSAAVRLSQVQTELARAHDLRERALDGLRFSTGLARGEDLQLQPGLQVALPTGRIDDWLAQALQDNPQLQQLRQQLDAADAGVGVARADLWPQIGAVARVDTHAPDWGASGHSASIGAQLRWDLLDGGVTRAAIDQAQARRLQLRYQLQSAQDRVQRGLLDDLRQEQLAESESQARQLAVQQAEEAARIVQRRYAEGMTSLLDSQRAQAALDQARADAALARQQINRQRAALRLALGQLGADAVTAAAAPSGNAKP